MWATVTSIEPVSGEVASDHDDFGHFKIDWDPVVGDLRADPGDSADPVIGPRSLSCAGNSQSRGWPNDRQRQGQLAVIHIGSDLFL